MEEKFVLTEVVNEDVVSGVTSEARSAGIKGFVVGASLIGVGWLATGLYRKFKNRKSEEVEEPEKS